MTTATVAMRVSGILFVLALGAGTVGCASKQVASTSGDQSTQMKGKATGAPGPTEQVRQEPVVSIPETPASRPGLEEPQPGGERAAAAPGTAGPRPDGPAPSGSAPIGAAPGASTFPSALASGEPSGPADIYFDFDQYAIRRDAQPVLEANAAWTRKESGTSLLIEGHCDERGTLAYNLVLGEKRARSAKRYLEDLGIPGSRMQTISYGEVRPFCREHNEGCWSKNRRAHFVVR